MVPIGQSSTDSNGACRPKQTGRQAPSAALGACVGRCARCYAAVTNRGSADRRHATDGMEAMVLQVTLSVRPATPPGPVGRLGFGFQNLRGPRGLLWLLLRGLLGHPGFGLQNHPIRPSSYSSRAWWGARSLAFGTFGLRSGCPATPPGTARAPGLWLERTPGFLITSSSYFSGPC